MRRRVPVPAAEWAVIGALTLLGLALRLPALGDSLFGDELSSYFVVTGRSLAGTLHLLNGNAIELNPPLYFLLAWTSEKLAGESQESLRLVSDGAAALWGLYAVCSCGAVYTHYTSIFLRTDFFGSRH